MFVDFHILNELGSPSINSNTFANRPPAGQIGRLFVSTDTYEIYRDNGSTWDLIGGPGSSTVTGTGAATQVAYWTASQAIGGSNNLWWDNTNGYLGVKTNTPTAGVNVVQTDGQAILSDFTTVAGSGNNAVAIYGRNTTNSSGYVAVLEEKTPNSSAGQYPIKIMHSLSSGTAAANMATGIHFSLPDDAGTERINQLSTDTVDPAAATYTSRYRFVLRNAGAAATPFYVTAAGLGVYVASPSGLIHADGGASAARMILDADAGVARIFSFRSDNLPRWAFRVDGAETGSNAGADLAVRAYNDAGAFTFAPLTIARATGKANWQATEAYSTGLARANYFDYNLSVSAGGSFSSPNVITALGASLDLTLAGNATIPSGSRSGLDAYNTISFTGTGTLTHNQGSQIRAYSNLTAGWAFAGSATGTITHLAGMRVLFPDNSGSAVTVTNNYGLLINDQTANTGTVTYTNRWGIYQEGSSDLNYMAANLLLGSTTNTGEKLQITGSSKLNGKLTVESTLSGDVIANLVNNSATGFGLRTVGGASGAGYALSVNNYLGTELMQVTGAGNVGIGTNSPNSAGVDRALTINGSTNSILELNYGGTRGGYLFSNNSNTVLSSVQALDLVFKTTDTERARITAGGNVLIGTTTDAGQKLQVVGDMLLSSSAFSPLSIVSATNLYPRIQSQTASEAMLITENTNTQWYIGVRAAAGIGTTNSFHFFSTNYGADVLAANVDGSVNFATSIKTGNPNTGTAANWKLGSRVAATVALDTTQYIEVDIGGTLYKLAIVT